MSRIKLLNIAKGILNENTYKVYHGTNREFRNFDFKNATQGIVWFTDSIDSIKNQEHGGMGNKFIMTRYITINNPAGWDEYEKYGLQQLQDMGYDGCILPQKDKTDYFVFSNKNISAKEPKIINELFDTNYIYDVHVESDDISKSPFTKLKQRIIRYYFTTKDNIRYNILLIIDINGLAEMHFDALHSGVSLINKHDAIKVFNTLKSIIYSHKKEIKKLEFRSTPERNEFYKKMLNHLNIKYETDAEGRLIVANLS